MKICKLQTKKFLNIGPRTIFGVGKITKKLRGLYENMVVQ
jgi:hypothetical protein